MGKYYIFIAGLIAFVCILIIAGFMAIGTPFDQQAINLDQQRIDSFTSISYNINSYTQTNGSLPKNLFQLTNINNIKDPQTNKDYTYQVLSSTAYSLCTDFSTDTTKQQTNTYSYSVNTAHTKGYGCISYTVPASEIRQAILPTATSTPMPLTIITPIQTQSVSPTTNSSGFYAQNAQGACCYFTASCDGVTYALGCGNKCTQLVDNKFCSQPSPTP